MPDDFSSSLFGFYPSPVVLDKSMISAPAGFSVSMGAGRGQEPMRVLNQNGSFMETCSSACKIQASDSCSSGHCVSRNASLPDDQSPVPELWVVWFLFTSGCHLSAKSSSPVLSAGKAEADLDC